jgi:hypothetical protein
LLSWLPWRTSSVLVFGAHVTWECAPTPAFIFFVSTKKTKQKKATRCYRLPEGRFLPFHAPMARDENSDFVLKQFIAFFAIWSLHSSGNRMGEAAK